MPTIKELEDKLMEDDGFHDYVSNYIDGMLADTNQDIPEWSISLAYPVEPMSPNCENYPDGHVLVLWPSGNVQKYPSLAKAKCFLFRHHHQYIICNGAEALLWGDYHPDTRERWCVPIEIDIPDADDLLWSYLTDISTTKDPWTSPDRSPTDSNRMSKRVTAAGYKVNVSKCDAFQNVKAPKQAKVIATLFSGTYEDGAVVSDEDIEKMLRAALLKGTLKTKQEPMRIFSYYRKELLAKQCIELRS
jgi:hypothetical protein